MRLRPPKSPSVRVDSGLPVSARAIALAAGVAIVASVVLVFAGRWARASDAARLPEPPRLSERQQAIERHLRERYDDAVAGPASIEAVGPLCVAYHADMFFDEAERCYEVAAAIDPGEWRWIYYRAVIQTERGGGEPLVALLRDVVARAPRFAPAWLRLGEAEFKAGRYDRAAEAWRAARELPAPEARPESPRPVVEVPLSAYALLGLARVALAQGEVDRAREMLEQVRTLAPRFGPALRLLAESYTRLGQRNEAARLVYRAGRLPPYTPYADPVVDELARESRNSTFLLRLASEADLAINAEWSEFLTRRALDVDPGNPDVVVKLGRILRTVGRNEEALVYFQRYHQMVPEDHQGLAHIGSCLSAMGRFTEAEPYLRKAVQGLDDPMTHYNLALLLAMTNRPDEAVAHYEAALARDPSHSDAGVNLAAALARQGRLDRAARELRRLLERDPDNAAARTNLGLVLLQQGRRDTARAELEEALRLDPQLTVASQALDEIREAGSR